MIKSKKGALFHWITFAVLGALGLFLILTFSTDLGVTIKGEQQLGFLQDFYLQGEGELLKLDQQASFVGKEVVLELVEKAGYLDSSECGSLDGINLWNKGNNLCFPSLKEDVNNSFNRVWREQIDETTYLIEFVGLELIGNTQDQFEIVRQGDKYSLDKDFRINLGYSFEEFFQLQTEAIFLLGTCSGKELPVCLNENKPIYWKFTSCTNELYQENEKIVLFCVESPNYNLFDDNGAKKRIEYKIGLDFNYVLGTISQ